MSSPKILAIDDEQDILNIISDILREEEMEVFSVSNEKGALDYLKENKVDLVLLDLKLGEDNGFDLLKTIREMQFDMPIIILSAKKKTHHKVLGLGIGADDYLTKPFDESELIARVNAHLRRYKSANNRITTANGYLSIDCLKIDLNSYKFYKNDKEIELSARAIKIMQYFMENPGRVFTKEQIYQNAWDNNYFDENTVMVYISNLRKKIEDRPDKPEFIKTVWGIGYKFMS